MTTDGYRCWRWNVERVEMLEHRWIADPGPSREVHHANRQRQDNRHENLEPLTHAEHGREHRRVPDETLMAMHAAGMRQTAIGAAVGLHSSQVSRRLRAAGVVVSKAPPNRVDVDETTVLARFDAGDRAAWIARDLDVQETVVRRVLRQHNRRGTPGRPRRVDRG